MTLRSMMRVLNAVRYDIVAHEENDDIWTTYKFDYVRGHGAKELAGRLHLIACGAKVDSVDTINGVLNIRVSYRNDYQY